MRFDSRVYLINEFKALVVTDLVAADDTVFAKLLSEVIFFIDFIANVVGTLFNIENLAALLKFIRNHIIFQILSKFQTI